MNKEVPLTFVNNMAQYRPECRVHHGKYEDINRRVTRKEMQSARQYTDKLGIAWKQVSEPQSPYFFSKRFKLNISDNYLA